jgi:hypothetical protein
MKELNSVSFENWTEKNITKGTAYAEVEKRISQLIWSGKKDTKEYWRLIKIRAKIETFKTK